MLPSNIKPDKAPRLTCNLYNKTNYVLHFENFMLYRKLGLQVTKIHRVVKFKQEAWMRSFINFNLQKRAETGLDIFKLANNSVFGKTMENVRKYRNITFENDPNRVRKIAGSPYYQDAEIIDENVIMMESKQKEVKLNKPIYCGMKILDLAKFHMYDIWYNILKPIFGDKLCLIAMDTDSFIFAITRNE